MLIHVRIPDDLPCRLRRTRAGLALLLGLAGCTGPAVQEQPGNFHPVGTVPQPWTHQRFDASPGKFSFAVFSDLTGSEREGVFDVAVRQINLVRPEFIINVGDLIEGSDDREEANSQWDHFDQRAGQARAPVFYVGGNHDLQGETLRAVWEERLGRRYYHFVHKNVLFLVLDTEDHPLERLREIARLRTEALSLVAESGWDAFYASQYANLPEDVTGAISNQQEQYLLQAIADNPDVRWTFILTHKSPWVEPALPAWLAIEDALADRPYTVFHGHKHAYDYEQRNGRDYIRLATTGGVQLPEFGRSMDHFFLVTVDDDGVDIANLLMAGVLDKTGRIPLGKDNLCFESTLCVDGK